MQEEQRVRIISGFNKGKKGTILSVIPLPISPEAGLETGVDMPDAVPTPLFEVKLDDGTINTYSLDEIEATDK